LFDVAEMLNYWCTDASEEFDVFSLSYRPAMRVSRRDDGMMTFTGLACASPAPFFISGYDTGVKLIHLEVI